MITLPYLYRIDICCFCCNRTNVNYSVIVLTELNKALCTYTKYILIAIARRQTFILIFGLQILFSEVPSCSLFPWHFLASQIESWNGHVKQIQWEGWSLPDFPGRLVAGQFVTDPLFHLLHPHLGTARSQHQHSSHLQQSHCIFGFRGHFLWTGLATFCPQVGSSTPSTAASVMSGWANSTCPRILTFP